MSSNWGIEGEGFTFLNFTETGTSFITRERTRLRLIFDDIVQLNVPGELLLITRLYQISDSTKKLSQVCLGFLRMDIRK